MPPRHHVLDDHPRKGSRRRSAAHTEDELLPTLRQLQSTPSRRRDDVVRARAAVDTPEEAAERRVARRQPRVPRANDRRSATGGRAESTRIRAIGSRCRAMRSGSSLPQKRAGIASTAPEDGAKATVRRRPRPAADRPRPVTRPDRPDRADGRATRPSRPPGSGPAARWRA